MRILFLTQYFPPEIGAPQNRLFELAVRLKKLGAHIEVLTAMPNYPQMEIHDGYKGKKTLQEELGGMTVYRTAIYVSQKRGIVSRLRNYFSFVLSSYRFGKKLPDFDFILCESPPLFLGYSAMRLSKKLKAKLIFNVSDLWPESAEKLNIVNNAFFLKAAYNLEAKCYRRSTLVTGQTMGIVNSIRTRFPDKNVFWLPNGVDLNYFDPDKTRASNFKERLGLQDKFVILYAGIIGHAQGLDTILKAAQEIQDSSIHFVLLGTGPVLQELLQLKSDLNIENVTFHDPVPKTEMPGIVMDIDASVVPLRKLDLFKGAIPSKIFEILAMKKPVLLGVDGEAKELFVDTGKCAVYFEPENYKELAVKAEALYRDSNQYNVLAHNAREYVDSAFNRNTIAQKFWEKLNSIQS